MFRRFITGIILGSLVLVSGTTGCDAISKAEKILPGIKQTTPKATAKKSNSSRYSTLEQSVHQQVNQYRRSRNLPPLTLDPRISEIARGHSQNMANGTVPFSHQGFDQRAQSMGQVIPYQSVAENVAFNQGYSDPVSQAVQGWIKSPGHRRNMEGNFDLTGIGIAKNAKGEYYFTQLFVHRRSLYGF